jgi:hypothetical protein
MKDEELISPIKDINMIDEAPRATINPSRKERQMQARKMHMPLFVMSYNSFFSSTEFNPREFNLWYRRDGFQRPIHGTYTLLTKMLNVVGNGR